MIITNTKIEGLFVVQPKVFEDDRGYFFESYNAIKTPELGKQTWVQDNESKSSFGVLRGLHLQTGEMAQAKLVRAIAGEIFDVAVDLRKNSNSFGKWHGEILSDSNKKQLYIPRGFAHGFLVLSDSAIFAYKCDNCYSKDHETGIRYDDQVINIDWPIEDHQLILSERDNNLGSLDDFIKAMF